MLNDKKKKILFTTSLTTSDLNKHIYESVLMSLRKRFDVCVFNPKQLELIDVKKHYDLLLYLGSSASMSMPIESIGIFAKYYKIPSVFWATDDPYEFDYRYRANDFDVYCSNDSNAAKYFLERENVYFLPMAAPLSDLREVNSLSDRTNALFFCGYPYNIRKLVVDELLSLDYFNRQNLIVCGNGWDSTKYVSVDRPQNHDCLIDYYCKSLFTLNIGRDYDVSNLHYNLAAVTPGPRTFESAICGTPQIYYSNSLSVEDFFVDEDEILTASSVEEVADKFLFYSNNLNLLRNITIKSQNRVLKEHTYEHRIDKLINILKDCGMI